MDKIEIYDLLNYVDASRRRREAACNKVLENPGFLGPLLAIGYQDVHPISSRAFWVLECVTKEHLFLLLPYLDEFTEKLGEIRLNASVRPAAKICESLLNAYFATTINSVQKVITQQHLEKMTICFFDWLIGDQKVAVKAYSMTGLLFLGRIFDWIHPELKQIVTENYAKGSAAYQARARMTLKELRKVGP